MDECNEKITIQISTFFSSFFSGSSSSADEEGRENWKAKQTSGCQWNEGFFYWHKISTISSAQSLFIYIHLSRFIIANNKTGLRTFFFVNDDCKRCRATFRFRFSLFETSKQYFEKRFILSAICNEFSISQLPLKRSANKRFDRNLLSLPSNFGPTTVVWL